MIGTVGCGEPSAVTSVVTAPLALPASGKLSNLRITLPHGRAMAFVAQPMNGDETLKSAITLESANPDVAEAFSTPTLNHFAVVGEGMGETTLAVVDSDGNTSPLVFEVEVIAP